ncbi:hypothetical protein H9P43_007071 [Blastocladiella emersonii ATCC 22665]|nr:hypothetical protein H9P43_007071 [Blastocladiella emersonii ATCC 22665]
MHPLPAALGEWRNSVIPGFCRPVTMHLPTSTTTLDDQQRPRDSCGSDTVSLSSLGEHVFPPAAPAQQKQQRFQRVTPARCTPYLVFSAFTASLAMFLFGYHISELSSAQYILTCARVDPAALAASPLGLFGLPACIAMSPTLDFGILSAMLSVGGLIGSLASSRLCLRFGRKRVLGANAVVLIASPVVMALAPGYWALALGRLLAGIGAGAGASVNSVYLADITPPHLRGLFGSLSQVMLQLGLVACGLMNMYFATLASWRITLAASLFPAVLQLVCVPWMAPSPKDVANALPAIGEPGHVVGDARLVGLLIRLWGAQTDPSILDGAVRKLVPVAPAPLPVAEDEGSVSDDGGTTLAAPSAGTNALLGGGKSDTERAPPPRFVGLGEFLTSARYRPSLIILSLAHFSLQASGINVYFAYSHSILTLLFDNDTANLVFVLSIAYHVVAILACGRLLDRWGRRPLFLAAYAVMGIAAFVLNAGTVMRAPVVALVAFFGAVTGFALGMGNVPYVLVSEVVDGPAIASAAAVSLTVNWSTQFFYLVAFLPLLAVIGSWVFVIIGAITLVAGLAAFFVVPETIGMTGAAVLDMLLAQREIKAALGKGGDDALGGGDKVFPADAAVVDMRGDTERVSLQSFEATTVAAEDGDATAASRAMYGSGYGPTPPELVAAALQNTSSDESDAEESSSGSRSMSAAVSAALAQAAAAAQWAGHPAAGQQHFDGPPRIAAPLRAGIPPPFWNFSAPSAPAAAGPATGAASSSGTSTSAKAARKAKKVAAEAAGASVASGSKSPLPKAFYTPLQLGLLSTLNKPKLCDVQLRPGGAKTPLFASRAVLVASSPFFRKLFTSHEPSAGTEHEPGALAALLRFADAAMVRTNSLLRKLVTKLATRVGLVMLRNKLPKWRYDRGSRSLEANIRRAGAGAAGGLVTSGPANPASRHDEDEEEDDEIPEQIEEVLHVVLAGLRDRDTIVRWSAAKGVGRITYRLPEELAADVVQSVIDLFNENVHASISGDSLDISGVSEHTWHGACLSIAELARRGLLLPAVLDTAMTWIQLALTFDIRRGNYSIGSPVRDAACYVCWSFARAYAPDIMRPHVHRLAPSLVCVSMYDREVHVRRAASAAFQENVGRQGIFPHGIDIVTAADFFTVGNRASAFLVAGRAIAAFDEYHPYCVRYLLENSVFHWDPAVRVLAAEALGVLVDLKPDIFQHLFDTLLPTITSTELGTRHGSAVALAEVILAAGSGVVTLAHADAAVAQLRAIAPAFLQTFGSELTRQGALKLVAALATVCAVPEATIDLLIPLIESSVERKEVPLQEAAAATAAAALRRVSPARLAAVVGWWVHAARPSGDQVARRGYALALGEVAMPLDLSVQTVEALIASTENLAKPQIDAEAKKNALQAVGKHVVQHGAALPPATVARIVAAFLGALDDYTTTSHGDVGSWVRMEAMAGLALVVEHAVLADPAAVVPAIARGVVHQTLSKIDRVREVAGPVLARLLAAQQAAGHIPAVDVLQRVVAPAAGGPSLDWSNSASVLAAVAPVLAEPFYRETAVLGYLLCMGGMTESLVKAAGQVLMDHLEGLADDDAALAAATDAILATLTSNYRVDRVVLPVLTALDILYANQSVLYAPDAFHAGVYAAVRREIAKVKDVNKILAAFKVLGGLAGVPHRETRTCAARYLAQQTCHVYPRVRKGAAETLLACAPIYAQACEDDGGDAGVRDVDRVTTLLTEVDWTLPIADVKAHRDELYAMLGVDGVVLPPVPDA